MLKSLYRKRGASLTGYGLILGLISIIAIGAITSVGGNVKLLFGLVANDMSAVSGQALSESGGVSNAAPTGVTFTPTAATIIENTNTTGGVEVATISAIDDGIGTNIFAIDASSPDAANFNIVGNSLFFDDGTPIFASPTDTNGDNIYEVTITVDDATIGLSPDASTGFTVTIISAEVKLIAADSDASDFFGFSVSLDGTTSLMGTPDDDEGANGAGAAYLFDCSSIPCSQTKLMATDSDESDIFGFSVSLDGTMALVGAYADDEGATAAGAAYLFDCSSIPCSQTKLMATDSDDFDYFGINVSLSGTMALVGAHGDDEGATDAGATYLFDCSTMPCSQTTKLMATDSDDTDYFGQSVSLDGTMALVGARYDDEGATDAGAAYLFDCSSIPCSQTKLMATDSDTSDNFGNSVSLDGTMALVGAYADDEGATDAGAAYLFDCSSIPCSQTKLMANDSDANDGFGFGVSLDGTMALLGAYTDDEGANDAGAAYLFDCSSIPCSQTTKLMATDSDTTDFFGFKVSLDGTRALVGAYLDDEGATDAGAAYLLTLP